MKMSNQFSVGSKPLQNQLLNFGVCDLFVIYPFLEFVIFLFWNFFEVYLLLIKNDHAGQNNS
jgi:hypothetical protein